MGIVDRSLRHEIGETVVLKESEEMGRVIGRAQYEDSKDQYLIRYKAGDGRQVEQWWYESAIKALA